MRPAIVVRFAGDFTIARRRYFRPQDARVRGPRTNEMIRVRQVRLIDENNEMIGVVPIDEALQRARDAEMDLVEVARDSDPPVCRILDYGKWKYEQAKRDKANKARAKAVEIKEVRLGRSLKIDPHDVEIRLNQARKFLMEGHKVQIVQNIRGREMMHRDRGFDRMKEITQKMADIAKVEVTPRLQGRRLMMTLMPDKARIESIKKRQQAQKANDEGNDDSMDEPAGAVAAAQSKQENGSENQG